VQQIQINPCTGEAKIFYTFPIPKLRTRWEETRLDDNVAEKAGSTRKKTVEHPSLYANLLVDEFIMDRAGVM
jgi:hypothetical protein